MAFQQGLSGLNASSKAIDAVSNNIANASTVGFKSGAAHFADVYASSLSGAGAAQIGIGVSLATVQQQFTQGNITTTNNPLDIAINGNGFFRVASNSGSYTYTRNGQFHVDKDYYIVNDQGYRLQGWLPTPTGTVVPTTPTDLKVDKSPQSAQATGTSLSGTGVQGKFNLDSRDNPPKSPTFSINDPDSYNYSNAVTIYDSRGNPHNMTLYFVKTTNPGPASGGQWLVYASGDGVANSIDAAGAGTSATPTGFPFTLNFDTAGRLSGFTAPTLTVDLSDIEAAKPGTYFGALDPVFKLDLTGTVSFGSASSGKMTQDGYPTGQLTNISITPDGMVQGQYSNGQTRNMGKVVLFDFANANGLQSLGNNQWAETFVSGPAAIGQPGIGNYGSLQSAAIEESNVDLTGELVSMITQQRNYQANAQSIKTQDQIMQTLVNLR